MKSLQALLIGVAFVGSLWAADRDNNKIEEANLKSAYPGIETPLPYGSNFLTDSGDRSDGANALLKTVQLNSVIKSEIQSAEITAGTTASKFNATISFDDFFNGAMQIDGVEKFNSTIADDGTVTEESKAIAFEKDMNRAHPGADNSMTFYLRADRAPAPCNGDFLLNVKRSIYNPLKKADETSTHRFRWMKYSVLPAEGNRVPVVVSWETDGTIITEVQNFQVYRKFIDFEIHNWVPATVVANRTMALDNYNADDAYADVIANRVWGHPDGRSVVGGVSSNGAKLDTVIENQGVMMNGIKATGEAMTTLNDYMGSALPKGETVLQDDLIFRPAENPNK
jgi:hypothetical protein